MSAFLQTQRPGALKPSPSKRGARKRRLSAGSLNGDDNNNNVHKEEEGSGGEDNDGQGGKKKAGTKAGAVGEVAGGGGPVEHKYHAEIAQMVSRRARLLCQKSSDRGADCFSMVVDRYMSLGKSKVQRRSRCT
jgi:hypothetical protein